MQFNQRLNIKHSQSIVMTPQLRQAIKLLQFSNLELSNYIEEEIEKNPFLERKNNNDINQSEDTSLLKLMSLSRDGNFLIKIIILIFSMMIYQILRIE